MASMQDIIAQANLTDQQRKSKTVYEIVKAAGGNEISEIETIMGKAETAENLTKRLESRINRAFKQIEQMQDEIDTTEGIIKDEPTRNGVAAYRKMLEATVDVFGTEKMTDEVICKAIEAASYGMWRSVMGPKSPNDRRM